MDKIKQLEIKKLMRELDYVESDFEYKSEIITDCDSKFMNSVNTFLENHPMLKEMFDEKINKKIEDIIKKNTEIIEEDLNKSNEGESEDNQDLLDDITSENNTVDKNPKLKKLYREIVKLTHPDKVNNKELNDIYIKSTEMYENNDIAGIYTICNTLKINYEIDDDDFNNISDKIEGLRGKISFVESTFTWKWHFSNNQQEKEQLILSYIRMQLQQ